MREGVLELIERVRLEHAPDPRTSIFEIDVARDAGTLVLTGATSVPAAVEALHARVAAFQVGLRIRDDIIRLPMTGDGVRSHAVVRSSTAPIMAGPLVSDSHLSQLVLGDRVIIFREHGRWLQCRAPDGYVGWIHRGYLQRMRETEVRAWELGAAAPLHFSIEAVVHGTDGGVLVRLPWGARVAYDGSRALLPDGLTGPVSGELVPVVEMPRRFPARGDSVVATARLWSGSPYLWGGVTHSGVDCSGLVQAVLRTHGIEMPRDSDQQERVGASVLHGEGLEELLPGDLLFFAERGVRVSHVAISMGASRIIHSALGNGGVRMNDLLGNSGFERELRSLLKSVRRVIPAEE